MKKIGFLFYLLLLLTSTVYSMDIEIGNGTTTSSYIPFYGYYDYSWSNFIIDSSLIGTDVEINQIQFNVSNTPAGYETLNQKIYFKHTSDTVVPVAYPNPETAGFTLVYDGPITWNDSGWQGVMLDTAFEYNGTDNLQIVWENWDGSYVNEYPRFYSTEVGYNISAYKYTDTNFPFVTGQNVTYFPNLKLGYDAQNEPCLATLLAPANTAVNISTTTTLEWELGENTTDVDVYFSSVASDVATMAASAMVVDGQNLTSYETAGLNNLTTYFWRVKSRNSANDLVVNSPIWSFTTEAGGGLLTVPVGNGITSSNQYPWNFYYKNSLAETIYLAEELNTGGQMQGLTYYNNFNSDLTAMPVNIWIGETTQADLSTYIPASQLTAVFSGTVDFPAGANSINITFDTPYNYTGGNLVVLTERELDEEYYAINDKFFNTTTTLTYRTLSWQDDDIDLDPETVTDGTVSANMPNVAFYFNSQGIGSLVGNVTDGNNALSGVNILINDTNYQTVTSDDGSFEFPYIDEGEDYTLTASLPDYYDETISFNVVNDQVTELNIILDVIPTIEVSGQITSSFTNAGIPASISLAGIRDYSVIADSLGNYSINNILVNNNYNIEISFAGYESYISVLSVEESDIEFNLVLSDLSSPNNLVASAIDGVISLTWDSVHNQDRAFLGYNLYRDGTILNNELITDNFYLDNDIIHGNTYSYFLTNVLDEGESGPSNIVDIFAVSFAGAGTQDQPYLINNLADLQLLSENSSLWKSSYHYEQTANIDASATETWNSGTGFNPIGNISIKFQASYNGNFYNISNLYINRPSSSVIGFFGYTNGANISNITLIDNDITGQHFTGGLVGYSSLSSTISNCSVKGSVTSSGTQVGGLIGYSSATTINSSFASGEVSGTSNIGGLVGKSNNTSTFNNCYSMSDVSGSGDLVGALIGYSDSSINYCYASGYVSGVGNNVGGLVGGSSSSSVNNSFWDTVTTNQTSSAGGTGLTTTEMQTLSTYINADWDFQDETINGFEDNWVYYANNYPRLSWDRSLEPDFIVNQTTIPYGSEVEFTNISLGNIESFLWEFGDGNSSEEENPNHTYLTSGIYTVTLTISNALSSESLTKTDFITVNAAPDISVNPSELNATLARGNSSTQYLTITNNGDELLEASLSIGSARRSSKRPEFISRQTLSNNQAIDTELNPRVKLIPSTKNISGTRTTSYSVLYVTAVGDGDSTFRTAVSNLNNVSQFDVLDVRDTTPIVEDLLAYDIVIVASNWSFYDSVTLGNNLATYCDAGGKLIALTFSFSTSGSQLNGDIITSDYLPLAVASYNTTAITGSNFISHPITQDVASISATFYAKTQPQGDGVSLGSYTNGYSIAAYNPHKPIVAINVFPKDTRWGGDFIQMINNTIDWFADPYNWLTLSESTLSIAPGASETVEVYLNSEDLLAGNYSKTIYITSNDPDEPTVNIPVTIDIVQAIQADLTADKTEILAGESIQFTDLSLGQANHWKWYLDNDDEVDSYQQNPSFTYNSNGAYSVSLVASYLDTNGLVVVSDSLSYSDYITVSGTYMAAGSYSGSWGIDSSPYNIFGSILIEAGTSLTVEAGVEVNFMIDTDFTVAGQLLADGVLFTSSGTETREEGIWQGITFTSSNNISSLTNSTIENASKGIEIIDASPTLRALEFRGLNREFPAIKITGSSNAILDDLDINDFNNGVEILGDDSGHTPVLTNIRVRHTTNTSRTSGVGVNIMGLSNVQMTDSLIEGFAIGLKISGENSSNITQNAIINNVTAIDISGAECSPQIYRNHLESQLEETATSFAFTNTSAIQILNNNILGFNIIVSGSNSSSYFSQNIIWGASILTEHLSTGTNLNSIFEYNDISMESGLALGIGNMNSDPLFIEDETYNLQLSLESECIDAGNPSLPLDPDGSIADLGMNYIHHLADFDSDDRFSNTGTIVAFENKSMGHDESSTSILWEFGDGDSSIERNPIHLYAIPGAYDVTLTMTTGSYSDVITRESFIIVQGQALSAPQNPTIVATSTGINLTWEEVTESATGTPTDNVVYFIYSCEDPAGTYNYRANVTSLSWIDQDITPEADMQFYFIIAYPTSARTSIEEFINSHRYLTRDGKPAKRLNLKK